MTNDFEKRLHRIDQLVLTPLVRIDQRNDGLEVIEWRYKALNKGAAAQNAGSYGLYRFYGQAQAQNENVSWSIILKAFGALSGTGSKDITAWNYWKREVLAYQSQLLSNLSGGLVAPRCFGVSEYPNQEYWIWLADLGDEMDAEWPLEQYGLTAHHLGQFNGGYLTGRPIPERPWLSKGRVRDWLAWIAPMVEELDTLKTRPNMPKWLPDDKIARVKRLWSKRNQLLAAMDKLPRCLCHHDAFRFNLMARQNAKGQEETVAVDWAFLGTGVVGEEIANSVAMNLNWIAVDAVLAHQLDNLVFTRYLAGLRDAGWHGEADLVRYGYTATISLCYSLAFDVVTAKIYLLDIDNDEQREQRSQQLTGHSLAAILEQRVALKNFYFDLEDEALDLMKSLG